jgi:hypothetical protein
MEYHNPMKPPPDNPEFAKFTEALRTVMSVSKVELQRRIEEEKQEKKARKSASLDSGASTTSAS